MQKALRVSPNFVLERYIEPMDLRRAPILGESEHGKTMDLVVWTKIDSFQGVPGWVWLLMPSLNNLHRVYL